MKNFKTGLAIVASMSLLLGACGKEEVKEDKKVTTEVVTTEEVTTESTESVENTQEVSTEEEQVEAGSEEMPNEIKIDVKQLKDDKGNAYKVPKEIKHASGTYAAYLDGQYKNQETRVEVNINEDGTYTLVRVKESTEAFSHPNVYFDKNNNFKTIDKEYHIDRLESGVVMNVYGSLVLAPIQTSNAQYNYINEDGQLEANHVSGGVEVKDAIQLSGDYIKITDGKINIGGTLVEKSKDLQYGDTLNKMAGEMYNTSKKYHDLEKNIYTFNGLNDMFQYMGEFNDHKYAALSSEELTKVYTEDNQQIKAKYGYKLIDNYESKVHVYDGKKLYRGEVKSGGTIIVEE
ncbi:hypothetical protein [Macrococcus equi]|uniref:hypothetical protein n=1 Tax=Macrococcus equi TaxID=3395462 RepID=UPI0039BE70F2